MGTSFAAGLNIPRKFVEIFVEIQEPNKTKNASEDYFIEHSGLFHQLNTTPTMMKVGTEKTSGMTPNISAVPPEIKTTVVAPKTNVKTIDAYEMCNDGQNQP